MPVDTNRLPTFRLCYSCHRKVFNLAILVPHWSSYIPPTHTPNVSLSSFLSCASPYLFLYSAIMCHCINWLFYVIFNELLKDD
jgi:hypothetical protein